MPVDAGAYMNEAQKAASALTFAKRYSFCNAFGILTGDEDDDSVVSGDKETETETIARPTTGGPARPATEKQIAYIEKLKGWKNIGDDEINEHFGKELDNSLTTRDAALVIDWLNSFGSAANIKPLNEEDKLQAMFIKDLEECATPAMYGKVAAEITLANQNGKLIGPYFDAVVQVAKITVARITQKKTPEKIMEAKAPDKPESNAARIMREGMEKVKKVENQDYPDEINSVMDNEYV